MGISFEVSSVASKGPKRSKCPLVESWVNQLWQIVCQILYMECYFLYARLLSPFLSQLVAPVQLIITSSWKTFPTSPTRSSAPVMLSHINGAASPQPLIQLQVDICLYYCKISIFYSRSTINSLNTGSKWFLLTSIAIKPTSVVQ